MLVFAVTNQKGGVGKSTTATNLAAVWGEAGERILVVDLDPHAGSTLSFGYDPDSAEKTIYEVMSGKIGLGDAVHKTNIPNVDLIPANKNLAAIETDLIGEIEWHLVLKRALESVAAHYGRVLLDCPPSLGFITMNALVASGCAIVPLQTEYLALRGIKQLQGLIEKAKKANPDLKFKILRTMYDMRTSHAKEVSEEIEQVFGENVFRTIIKRSIKFPESTVAGQPITRYAVDSEGAQAYRDVAKEI